MDRVWRQEEAGGLSLADGQAVIEGRGCQRGEGQAVRGGAVSNERDWVIEQVISSRALKRVNLKCDVPCCWIIYAVHFDNVSLSSWLELATVVPV